MQEGIYDQLINEKITKSLQALNDEEYKIETERLDVEEAKIYLSNYIAEVTSKALALLRENKGSKEAIKKQIQLCNHIINELKKNLDDNDFNDLKLIEQDEVLTAVYNKINNVFLLEDKKVERPKTSISKSSLFTGSENEPNLKEEFIKEINTSDQIDWLVSFIRWTGIRDLMDVLEDFTNRGGRLRIITTSYMEATDYKAVERLSQLKNTEIKVSLDKKRTRLHAKSYMFKRNTGFSTAYIGSSNLSNPALTAGLEWNLKVTEKDSFEIINKCEATFETYWNDDEFILLSPEHKENWSKFKESLVKDKIAENDEQYYFDIYPYPYQQEILDTLSAERYVHNRWKNLVVAATGVGKTVISAFDFKNHLKEHPEAKLLFVAHREEILQQSLNTFRHILKDQNFGDLFVGKHKPSSIDHLFISIQSWNSQDIKNKTTKDFYDFIIVDEVHHAPAETFDNLLTYYEPKILLGLTATPERMDGKDVLEYFNHYIASEIRLTEAINKKLLSPFHYFCITDNVDLSNLSWSRGGYEINELSNLYTSNDRRSDLILKAIDRYLTDIEETRGLGFCVSVEHAKYMANYFNGKGIKSKALHGKSSDEDRRNARQDLRDGSLKFIFVVDLYNEGVDIPEVNTILFLRPTESMTIFLQQLGRGLRLSDNKECLTVLDFVGQAHKNYSFEEKFQALIGKSKYSVKHYLEHGFFDMPKGSTIYMEKIAKEYILNNVNALQVNKKRIIQLIKQYKMNSEAELTLINFLKYNKLSLADVYGRSSKRSFSQLLYEAGLLESYNSTYEKEFTSQVHKLFHLDSAHLIDQFIKLINGEKNINEKIVGMLYYSFFNNSPNNIGFKNMIEGINKLFNNPQWKNEALQILEYKKEQIHFIEKENPFSYETPLRTHAHYNTNQIMAAFGYYNNELMPQFREGVKYFSDLKTDIFFITLNKSDKDFSTTTQYDDYAINDILFHWQSQNKTSDETTVGQRYINHKKQGVQVALFVREYKTKDGFTSPFVFLGTANYVSHEGNKPMSIIWKLNEPLPSYLKPSAKKASI